MEEGRDKSQSNGYLPAYLKKVEEETDVPESTIEELVEINLDLNDLEKKVLVGAQLTKVETERIAKCLKRNKDILPSRIETYQV